MNKFLLLIITFLFISCNNPNEVYDKKYTFSQNRWKLEDKKTFEFDVTETGNYNIKFLFSHVYDYQFVNVPLLFELKNEIGKVENIPLELAIKENGEDIGDCAGDYCDIYYSIKSKVLLNKGTHKIFVSNTFDFPYLPNVLAIGIKVEKIENQN